MAQVSAADIEARHHHALASMNAEQRHAMNLELDARIMASFTALGAEARRQAHFALQAKAMNGATG